MGISKADLIKAFGECAAKNGWKAPDNFPADGIPGNFFPARSRIFRALELLCPTDVRFVILGQDPYYDTKPGTDLPIATGVAFGVESIDGVGRSCAIYKILKGIYGDDPSRYAESNLESWAQAKGVLLLNAALTVQQGPASKRNRYAGGHLQLWEAFVTEILGQVSRPEVVMVAWGSDAHRLLSRIHGRARLVASNHPVASSGHLGKFAEFWNTEVGRALRCTQ